MNKIFRQSLGRLDVLACGSTTASPTGGGEAPKLAVATMPPASWLRLASFVAALVVCSAVSARADYVGSDTNRLFLDPDHLSSLNDGYQNGDEFAYIMETTPADTGSTNGNAAWQTIYVPAGVEIIGVEFVKQNGGSFTTIPAEDTHKSYAGWGSRGSTSYAPTTGVTRLANGYVNEVQQDTGIFYSTDSRTKTTTTAITPTNAPTGIKTPQATYNQWDYDQTNAFGEDPSLSLNTGKGNTPLISTNSGTSWTGTGSMVAGPNTRYTNDYNPACNGAATCTGTVAQCAFAADLQCTGPWNRITTANDKIGGTGTITPATATGAIGNTSVTTATGITVSSGSPLPASTNAVRLVHGHRVLGDIELSRIFFRITNATTFTASFTNDTFCLESTGGDTSDTAAKDNPWRYYEPVHKCYDDLNGPSVDGQLLKQITHVDGTPGAATFLNDNDILGFTITFTNTSGGTLTNVNISDTRTAPLTLVEPGSQALCPYSSYNGNIPGPTYTAASATTGTAHWAVIPSLAAGASVTVYMCGRIGAVADGDVITNTANVTYTRPNATSGSATSVATGTAGSGRVAGVVFLDTDNDGSTTDNDDGIEGVTVELWHDVNNNGVVNVGTDTLEQTTVTLADGSYEFLDVGNGNYVVRETDPSGVSSTADKDNAGGTCATGNGCNQIDVTVNNNSVLGQNFYDFGACNEDSDCSDSLYCNGTETCVAFACVAGTNPCTGGGVCSSTCNEATDSCFATAGTVCRSANGSCDVAETCTGTSASCPTDSFLATTTVCRGTAGSCDVAETCSGTSGACPSDTYLGTTTVCRGTSGSCDVAESCTGTAAACPADGFVAGGNVCRGASTLCDAQEVCTGTAGACPADSFQPTTVTCRTSVGACDAAETCNGTSSTCPADTIQPNGTACGDPTNTICDHADTCQAGACVANLQPTTTVCRADAGECDVAETCNGAGSCPADAFEAPGFSCGSSSTSICDHADTCNGSGTCQPNNEPNTTVCRADAGECDVAETCNGAGSCPADAFEANGFACGDSSSGLCDSADTCNGSGTCQPNHQPNTTVCRADAGQCDVQETCDGNGACPADAFEANGFACGDPSSGLCDSADTCNGSGTCQPNHQPNTTVCRADAGQCDVAETCDGNGACPADAFEANGFACGDPSSGLCDSADTCNGSGTCQPNHEPNTTVCRADAGQCDVAETCDGNGACPADSYEAPGFACGNPSSSLCDAADSCDGNGSCQTNHEPGTTVCRADAGECDVQETCDGNGSCPADAFEANGFACGDPSSGICDNADTCNGSGTCQPNHEPGTTVCRADAGECDVQETCDGNGACPADAFEANGFACGDSSSGVCDSADTCNGSGTCQPNHEPGTTVCRADAGECDVQETCDGNGACPADAFEANGFACGDSSSGVCDNADTCNGSGTCQPNHQPNTTVCRADAGQCDVQETCDGNGACPADAFEAPGFACGDPSSGVCDNADTCNGSGTCQPNHEPGTTVCRADAGECDVQETCDGNGSCPADAFEANGFACGDPSSGVCDSADSCVAGTCQPNHEPGTTVCRADAGECDVQETCDGNGACPADAFEANGFACGDPSSGVCDNADTCNGSGTCQPNHEPGTTVCRADAGECDVQETCDGNGACPADAFEANGFACGDSSSGVCDNADTCNGSGTCQPNHEPGTTVCRADAGECDVQESCDGNGSCPADAFEANGFACGDSSSGVCDNADTCNGSGTCQPNHEPGTTVCRADAGECDVQETCDGNGACPADAFESNGTACGDPDDSICDHADTCNGSGSCQPNLASVVTVCRADVGQCDVEETCDGAGNCPADAFEASGFACGNPSSGVCDDADTCDGAGSCQVNHLSIATLCRPDAGECDVEEFCDGAGACPADAYEASGTACGDPGSGVCDSADTCSSIGTCLPNHASAATVCRADAGECDVQETCDGNGACPADAFEANGFACGDSSSGLCDNADTCNGSGTCQPNHEPGTTVCRADAGDCDVQETCDGNGACPVDSYEAVDTACGSTDDTECDDPDSCDGSGTCLPNNVAATTPCGDSSDTVCDNADTCDGSGSCQVNHESTSFVCRGDAGECDVAETCDSNGACPADAFEPADTACGDSDDSICDHADTCDGSGTCQGNIADSTTVCRADAGECDVEEKCDGLGACPADAFEPVETACGSTDDTQCDNPDFCDGSGTCATNVEPNGTACGSGSDTICDNPDTCVAGNCVVNNEPITTLCRAIAGDCDVAESCNGAGSCPADASAPNGTTCDDGNACTENDACSAGACTVSTPVDCEDGDLCTSPTCNPAVGCEYEPDVKPLEECFQSNRGRLAISDRPTANKDVIRWTWRRGEFYEAADVGDVMTTAYAVCIFDFIDGEPALVSSLNVPAGSPKWKRPKGGRFRYIDSPGSNDGIRGLRLIPRSKPMRSKVVVRGRGLNIELPHPYSDTEMMDVNPFVTVQFRTSNDSCWESSFTPEETFRNTRIKYRGKYREPKM